MNSLDAIKAAYESLKVNPFLTTGQLKAFEKCTAVLAEDPKTRTGQQIARTRIRILLADILLNIGCEPFVLCAVSVPLQSLGRSADQQFRQIETWWRKTDQACSPSFQELANGLCESHRIEASATRARNAVLSRSQNIVSEKDRQSESPSIAPERSSDSTLQNQLVAHTNLSTHGVHSAERLTSDVYTLTVEHAQVAVMSDQVQGEIWLTNPYDGRSSPFITIPISRFLSSQLARGLTQVM